MGGKINAILCSIAQMSNQKVIELRSASKGADKQTPAVKETVSEQQCETASSKFVQYQAAPIVENNQQVETAEPKKRGEKKKPFVPKVMEGAELAAAMKKFQEVVEPAVEVGSCWECEGCTGTNPPSAQVCLVAGCGVGREKIVHVAEKKSDNQKVSCEKRKNSKCNPASKVPSNAVKRSKGGRKPGSLNVCVPLSKLKRSIDIRFERSYWKEHKMVSQSRSIYEEVDGKKVKVGRKTQQKCYFFRQSGTGMCPHTLAVCSSNPKDGRCSKYCVSCKKPFHEICTWVYQSAVLKGFDVDFGIREVWVREGLEGLSETEKSDVDSEMDQSDS